MMRNTWIIASMVAVLLFGSGFLVGREFPVHHYERFGNGFLLYDTSTGRVCTTARCAEVNFLEQGMQGGAAPQAAPPPGFTLDPPKPYPRCGE